MCVSRQDKMGQHRFPDSRSHLSATIFNVLPMLVILVTAHGQQGHSGGSEVQGHSPYFRGVAAWGHTFRPSSTIFGSSEEDESSPILSPRATEGFVSAFTVLNK